MFATEIRDAVRAAYAAAAAEAGWAREVPAFAVERPKDPRLGDYAANVALQAAKPLRQPPRAVAERILRHLELPPDFAAAEVAGAGFLNFRLSQAYYPRVIGDLIADPRAYLASDCGGGPRILLEFVSANPTGPLNIVSARAAAVGDTLGRLLRLAGHAVLTEFYVNDAGHQVEMLARSILARREEILGRPWEIPEDGYHGEYVRALAEAHRAAAGEGFDALPEGERVARVRDWALREMERMRLATLERYGVHFDSFFSERAFRERGGTEDVVGRLSSQGHTYEQDGALWLRTTAYGDDKDRVVRKSDGEFTYFAPDIGYHETKYQRGYDCVIDLLGPDHHGYVARMRAALSALGHQPETFEVLIVQWVRFLRHGEVQSMSKRAGEIVTIDELLDDVGADAARFLFLMRSHDTPLDFDLALAKEESSENPVYYVQYAHARIASILRQAGKPEADPDYALLTSPEAQDLLRRLGQLPEEIREAAAHREPHRLTRLAMELAQAFHAFYNRNRVLGVEPPLSAARLRLVEATQAALAELLDLLGVSAPERM